MELARRDLRMASEAASTGRPLYDNVDCFGVPKRSPRTSDFPIGFVDKHLATDEGLSKEVDNTLALYRVYREIRN